MRIKGTQLLGVVKALRAQPGASAERAPAHLRRYYEERVLAASWYPETDFRDLMLLLGRQAAPGVKGNIWRIIGQMGAERDFKGIYASLIRQGDVSGTLRLFPTAWRQFRDQSQLACEELGPGAAQVTLREYPVNCRELSEVNAAYFETALRLAGATTASVTVVSWDNSSACWQVRWE